MENKIKVSEILRYCPKGTKLYSTVFGELKLQDVLDGGVIETSSLCGTIEHFFEEGFYSENGECVLFPSRKMRDWTKFFKRGDVVCNKDGGMYAIFEGWVNDDYTEFNTTINYYESIASFGTEEVCYTDCFVKASDEERAAFIANAEKYYNGKYNPETLQVEPVKPKCPFKPFDKVLARDDDKHIWRANYFSHYSNDYEYPYCCINGFYRYCIPYNEHTAHLLGTTDPYTEGGSE